MSFQEIKINLVNKIKVFLFPLSKTYYKKSRKSHKLYFNHKFQKFYYVFSLVTRSV